MPDVDIAVVGGGISGLYAAWRLTTLPNPPKVALFESSHRFGGRIDTAEMPVPTPLSKAEFGAMRFLPSMRMVASLLSCLGIGTEPFPGIQLQNAFLRGVQVDLGGGANLPYRLAAGEAANPAELLVKVINGAVAGATGLSAQQWREVVQNGKFKGAELWRWGFENVAGEFISNEAYAYLCDTSGLDSALLTANAAISLRCLTSLLPDFAAGKVFRPVNGFGSLIDALRSRLTVFPSCNIHSRSRVISLERVTGGLALNFAPPGGPSEVAVDQVTAGRVIFAMPRRALELIDFSRLFSDQSEGRTVWMRKLSNVDGIPAFKLCMEYAQPWWQNFQNTAQLQKGWNNGYAVTDLPLRQVFFGLGVGPNDDANQRVMLASYADTQSARFWTGEAQVGGNTPLLGALDGPFQPGGNGILAHAVNSQLCTLLQIAGPLPEPLAVGFMDWSSDPFGGGWHEWKPGVDVSAAIPDMRNPIPGAPLYVCGEAYSWFQSWIEGALMSAERMLQDHFQLRPPSEWLPQDYDLGP